MIPLFDPFEPSPAVTRTPGQRVRAFNCQCGSPVFFRNSICLACNTPLGYAPTLAKLVALTQAISLTPGLRGKAMDRCIAAVRT